MIKTIPLNKLIASPRNVRRAEDARADLELKADIEARGLIQNLVVTRVTKPRGSFAVEAGERRRRALQSLAAEGKLAVDHEVCCLVIDRSGATETSLAENFQRLAMNPADECLAFGQLIEQGADVERIARRFGLTVRFVEGRLRLSALAPEIFEALGSGEISLDVAKAYAATADRERQSWVFEQLKGSYSGNHPDSIRRMMTQATASPNDRRARLVGEDAYVAAGGRLERDLFSEDSGERWLDLPLLERLAAEKMEALAEAKTADLGLAWVRPTLESWVPYELTAGLQRIVPDREPLTAEDEARIVAAEAEIDGLIPLIDAEETTDEERREAEDKVRELDREIERLRDKPPVIDEELRPRLGAFLILGDDGEPRLDRVFYAEMQPEPEAEGGEPCAGQSFDGHAPVAEAKAGDQPKPLSRALVDELAIQRRDILAASVAADPEVAFDLATFLMVDRDAVLSSEPSGSSLLAVAPSDPVFGFKTPEARATLERAKMADELDRSWTSEKTRSERFDAFRALPKKARAAWLAHAVARTLEASSNGSGQRRCVFHDHLGELLGIDVWKWWRPTGANYFDRVPKTVTLAALEEIGGPAFTARYAGMKKAELSQSAERIFAGEIIAEVELKERALAWVPEPMRFAAPEPSVADADETPPWEDDPADGDEQSDHPEDEREGSDPELDGDELSVSIEEAA